MKHLVIAVAAAQLLALGGASALAQPRAWNALNPAPSFRAPEQIVEIPRGPARREANTVFRSQGVSSLHGGMGNMGGGTGRSANSGVGLGGIGASQGARN